MPCIQNGKLRLLFNHVPCTNIFEISISRFSYEEIGDEPDWEQLRVLHAWGSRSAPGVYSEIATAYGFEAHDWSSARTAFGSRNAFEGACKELQASLHEHAKHTLFDAILIDEAQDFPSSFFQLVYAVTSLPKRIIWAYDELQNLGDYVAMAPPSELFGMNEHGEGLVQLHSESGRPRQDIVLKRCYRNTPWALSLAHALWVWYISR